MEQCLLTLTGASPELIDGPPYLVYNPGPTIRKIHGLLGHDSLRPVFYT
jgi:hypothetical protein